MRYHEFESRIYVKKTLAQNVIIAMMKRMGTCLQDDPFAAVLCTNGLLVATDPSFNFVTNFCVTVAMYTNGLLVVFDPSFFSVVHFFVVVVLCTNRLFIVIDPSFTFVLQ